MAQASTLICSKSRNTTGIVSSSSSQDGQGSDHSGDVPNFVLQSEIDEDGKDCDCAFSASGGRVGASVSWP
jgi:hypothetical protein